MTFVVEEKGNKKMKNNTVTQKDIDRLMKGAEVNVCTAFDKCTVVTVRLENGFVITESSACVDPANYDAKLGVDICLERIKNKLWELEGYCLQKKLYEEQESEGSYLGNWAENEIRIACERERAGAPEDEWDYGVACYESAYKAFKSLMNDGHSGMSIGFTKNILNRLIDGKPLTPIEDVPEVWDERGAYKEGVLEHYQCKRMSSLFKDVYHDGTVKYSDIGRHYCVDTNKSYTYYSGLVNRIIEEMYPITMPYMPPTKPMAVYAEDFLVDPKNGDFDTVGIFYILHPNGERTEINRFFKDGEDDWIEISIDEYQQRKSISTERKDD